MKLVPCGVDGCEGNSHYTANGKNGYCSRHAQRLRRHGSPRGGKTDRGAACKFYEDVVLGYEGDECLTWPFSTIKGYAQIKFNGERRLVSRLACEAEHGPAPSSEHHAAHGCGRGHQGCVAKRHLSWKLPVDNSADKVGHGTVLKWDRHHAASLTTEQVKEMRRLLAEGHRNCEVAKRFAVSDSVVANIKTETTWRGLEP